MCSIADFVARNKYWRRMTAVFGTAVSFVIYRMCKTDELWLRESASTKRLPLKMPESKVISHSMTLRVKTSTNVSVHRISANPITITLNAIKSTLKCVSHPDIEVVGEEMRISLQCPISAKRMSYPGRFKNCKHIECFDVHNFLFQNIDKISWRCPHCHCKQDANSNHIEIDGFFLYLLLLTDNSCKSVFVSSDGDARQTSNRHKKYRTKPEIITID